MSGAPAARALAYAFLGAVAIALPPLLAAWHPAFVSSSYGARALPFELLGLTGALAGVLAAILELRRRGLAPGTGAGAGTKSLAGRVPELVPVLVPLAVWLHFLMFPGEHPHKPFDYDCYEYAGRVVLAGENPYRYGLLYLYPPLTAQAFASAFRAAAGLAQRVGASPSPDAVWDAIFYLYQCAQLLLVVLAYHLGTRLARQLGLDPVRAALLVGALLVLDNPLYRTLRHGQLNLWVLDLALVGALLARRAPVLGGLALAISIHLKLYPALLVPALALAGRGRAAAWALAWVVALLGLETDLGRDWAPWAQYLDFVGARLPGEVAFRNSSLHSVLYNGVRLATGSPPARPGLLGAVLTLASAGLLAWLALRLWARRGDPALSDASRLVGQVGDALAFGLLLSPSVWEHHFVFALPLAILAAVQRGRERPWLVAGALLAVFAVPTFDLFPLGYHRGVGLLALLLVTAPGRGRTVRALGGRPVFPSPPLRPPEGSG